MNHKFAKIEVIDNSNLDPATSGHIPYTVLINGQSLCLPLDFEVAVESKHDELTKVTLTLLAGEVHFTNMREKTA